MAIPHEEFRSTWCSTDIPTVEEDVNLEYDPFTAAGVALLFLSPDCESALSAPVPPHENNFGCHSNFNGAMPSLTYAQQKSSYLVKIIANLHCFVPNICEGDAFSYMFMRISLRGFLIIFHLSFLTKYCIVSAEEERNLFLNKFQECLCTDASGSFRYPSNFKAQKAAIICENLSILLLLVKVVIQSNTF